MRPGATVITIHGNYGLLGRFVTCTPISGDYEELIPPYIGSRHSGRTLSLNRTKADRGSNPLRSTCDNEPFDMFQAIFYFC